jgi:Protein of unknown function, DUF481
MSGSRQPALKFARSVLALAICALFPRSVNAGPKVDVVRLKNGDRLTCEIKELQFGVLTLSTDALDTVFVHWGEVASIESPRSFEVTLESGDRLYGGLGAPSAAGQVEVVDNGTVVGSAALSRVTTLVPIGASAWTRMDGSVDVGSSFTQANLETHVTLNGSLTYRSPSYRLSSNLASQVSTREDAGRTLRNTLSLTASRLFHDRWFVLVLSQIQQNEELDLDLRTVIGGGGGRAFWQSNHHSISGYGGLVDTREHFAGQPPAESAEIALGTELDFFSPATGLFRFFNSGVAYFDVSGRARTRVEAQSSWQHKFLGDFYWSVSGVESFDSDPPEGQKRNDVSASLSLGWKF